MYTGNENVPELHVVTRWRIWADHENLRRDYYLGSAWLRNMNSRFDMQTATSQIKC